MACGSSLPSTLLGAGIVRSKKLDTDLRRFYNRLKPEKAITEKLGLFSWHCKGNINLDYG